MNKEEYVDDSELIYLISDSNEDASDMIFKKYHPVIDYYAKKYSTLVEGKGIDYNDLYQEGLIGLNSAINNYKDQKDIKFSTFAFMCIKRKIFTAVKIVNRKKHRILNESFSLDYVTEDDAPRLEDVIKSNDASIEDSLVSNEDIKYFNKRVKEELTVMEKNVYDLKMDGLTKEEIANTINKTYKAVESTLTRIKIKIKKILDEIN